MGGKLFGIFLDSTLDQEDRSVVIAIDESVRGLGEFDLEFVSRLKSRSRSSPLAPRPSAPSATGATTSSTSRTPRSSDHRATTTTGAVNNVFEVLLIIFRQIILVPVCRLV